MPPVIAGSEVHWTSGPSCPGWCAGGHDDGAAHWGSFADMELLLHRSVTVSGEYRVPDRVLTVLRQGQRELRPTVRQYSAHGRDTLTMTLDEAGYLGNKLLQLVAEARESLASRAH